MEVMFQKSVCTYLQMLAAQTKNQEITQELRIPDSMPDIGRVLGCWGQVIVRSKEWKNNSMNVSGGLLVWCMYSPEDGSEARCTDTWIPFQENWDFPPSVRDGMVYVSPYLSSVDARCISARKLMFRCNVEISGEALEQSETMLYAPDNLPKDIELLYSTYPMDIPEEAGEKTFQVDEVLSITDGKTTANKIVYCKTDLEITEQRVMTNKVIFRGCANLHILYMDQEGYLRTYEWKQPFSQLSDLDKDYGNDASAWIMPVLTGQEVEIMEDGQLQYKCGIAAQYVIYDRKMICVVEDAYSNERQLNIHTEEIKLPARLDQYKDNAELRSNAFDKIGNIVDTACLITAPDMQLGDNGVRIAMNGQFHALYTDENGTLQGQQNKCRDELIIQSDSDNQIRFRSTISVNPQIQHTVGGEQYIQEVVLEAEVLKNQEFVVVSGLDFGEIEVVNEDRPSVILKRIGDRRLWDVAKECKSTVAAIKEANALDSDTVDSDRLLLIPVK